MSSSPSSHRAVGCLLCHGLFLASLPQFIIITDHQPLVPILNTHHLDEIEDPRLQHLKNNNHGLLIMVDCFTDWPDFVHMGHDTWDMMVLSA